MTRSDVFTRLTPGKGSTARIAPHMLVTCDLELYKKMNAVRGDWVRSEWYTALRLHPKRDNITSVTDEDLHADLRKRMAPGVGLLANIMTVILLTSSIVLGSRQYMHRG